MYVLLFFLFPVFWPLRERDVLRRSCRLQGIVPKDASRSRKRTIRGERFRTILGPAVRCFPLTKTRACIERESIWRIKVMLLYRALFMYS